MSQNFDHDDRPEAATVFLAAEAALLTERVRLLESLGYGTVWEGGSPPAELLHVEAILDAHPAVAESAVLGQTHPTLGERVVAFIVGSAEVDAAECRRWFAEHGVARFKTPELVVHIDEVPLLAAGKPDRGALKARAAALPVET